MSTLTRTWAEMTGQSKQGRHNRRLRIFGGSSPMGRDSLPDNAPTETLPFASTPDGWRERCVPEW
jgi:hypothetical protein